MLCEQLKKERIETAHASRGRSPANYTNNNRNRSTSANRNYMSAAGPDTSKLETQIGELRRNLNAVESDNEKLKDTMREMVDDYTRQLELRDETIMRLENSQPN
jgi:predicted RNase H-like nuclease (RuvC/YqgF family)